MSLLMSALKTAERRIQEKLAQSSDNPPTLPPSDAPGDAISLLPLDSPIPSATADDASTFPPLVNTPLNTTDDNHALQILPTQEEPVLEEKTPVIVPPAKENARQESAHRTNTPLHHDAPQAALKIPAPPASTPKVLEEEKKNSAPSAAQQKAKSIFTSKQVPRKRHPWIALAIGILVVVAAGLGGLGYYLQAMSQSFPNITANPAPAASATPAVATGNTANKDVANNDNAPPIPAAATPPPAAPEIAKDNLRQAQQALPDKAAAVPDKKPDATVSKPIERIKDKPAAPDNQQAIAQTSTLDNPAIQIRLNTAGNQIHLIVDKAYRAFTANEHETAQSLYQKVLQLDPNNRDALLGLAAIALHKKQNGRAAGYYERLLELDPSDPTATAALINLQAPVDLTQIESRLKKLLAQNPQEASSLFFALGNVYAKQSRWQEAQQNYFRAYSGSPNNADYVFNLAVTLDILNQGKPALSYYRQALALAQNGVVNFDKGILQTRIKELQSSMHQDE